MTMHIITVHTAYIISVAMGLMGSIDQTIFVIVLSVFAVWYASS